MNRNVLIAILGLSTAFLLYSNLQLRRMVRTLTIERDRSLAAMMEARPERPGRPERPEPRPTADRPEDTGRIADRAAGRPPGGPPPRGNPRPPAGAANMAGADMAGGERGPPEDRRTQREERIEQQREMFYDTLDNFIENTDLEPEVSDELVELMESTAEARREIVMQGRADGLSREEVRDEIDQLREETAADMAELLGEEDAELLLEQLRENRQDQ